MKKDNIRKKLIKIGREIVKKNLVTATGGNISVRSGNHIYIKAKNTRLDSSKLDDYIKVDLKTENAKKGSPSSEKPMHIACYDNRPDVGAVVHVHPVFSTAVANSGMKLGLITYELAAILVSGLVRAGYKPSGSKALAVEIGRLVKKSNAILMPNHGLLTVGKTPDEALERALAVERACQTLIFSRLLGTFKFLPKKEAKRIIKLYKK